MVPGVVLRYWFKTNPSRIHHSVNFLGLGLQFVLQKLFRWSIGVLDMSKHSSCRVNLLYFMYDAVKFSTLETRGELLKRSMEHILNVVASLKWRCAKWYKLRKWVSRSSSVDIVTELQDGQPKNCASVSGSSKTFFPSPKRRDRLWDPPSLIFTGHRVFFFPRG